MKKICFVTTIYLTYHCFLKNFAQYLHDSGEYDVSLICDSDSADRNDLQSFVHYYPVTMKRGVSLSGFSAIGEIRKIFSENMFDIVQYSTPNAAFYASSAARKAGVSVRLYCQWGIRYMGFDGWKRRLFKALEKITCSNSTYIEAESGNIRQFALSEGLYPEDNSCVIWNGSASGVDLDRYDLSMKSRWRSEVREELGVSDDDLLFLSAGRMTADKGINELLSAFLDISANYPKAKLLIISLLDNDGTIDSDLYSRARECPQIVIPGSREDIERYYAASDIFVSPSYREGFGLVIVEAAAMGLPAVVTDVPGQIDAVVPDETGLLCKAKDVITLETAMKRLLDDEDLREKMGEAAEAYARSAYDQRTLFEKLMAHRDELVSGVR